MTPQHSNWFYAAKKKCKEYDVCNTYLHRLIPQPHYPNRYSPDGRWAPPPLQKYGRTGNIGTDFGRFLGRPTAFLSKHRRKKFRWPIRRFLGVLSSVKRRAMVGWHSADILKKFISNVLLFEGRTIIGRQSADDRQTVGRRYFIKKPSVERRRIWYRPIVDRHN